MPKIPIIMPQLGESIAEAIVVEFLVQPGDRVEADQDIIEVETNKATMNVAAPCGGTLLEFTVDLQESYPVGAELGWLKALDGAPGGAGDNDEAQPGEAASERGENHVERVQRRAMRSEVKPTVGGLPVPANATGASYMTPRMKARMQELGLHAADLAGIPGTGAAGRVTIEDFEKFLSNLEQHKLTPASTMRVAVADAMRRSWSRPLATVGMPVVLDALLAHRKASDPKPGPALYALRALAIALGENSAPAGRLVGNHIVHPDSIDVGFAVEAEDGVLVPVIREAERKTLQALVESYTKLVALARERKLPPEATGGSIATVTNFGTFGLTWATPIPLPEQTLVLGMGAGRKAPYWDDASETFVPRTEAQLTLSFDHRVMDGGAAGRLLARVAELMNRPDSL
jgi:pyruvate/2-oxoglutarate dehydrogenase complex dihydrolipoamide acyltransferase (E2) component